MNRLGLSPAARADLSNIWDYTAKTWGIDQAETYIRALDKALQSLAGTPGLGRRIDGIRPGYLKFPAVSHVIFYKLAAPGIDVIRILHKSMDVERNIQSKPS